MLRNLVTSLVEHEQIKTTLPKARDTARLAEKIITLGKKGDRAAHTRASAFLLKPELLPKVFGTFAERYADRPGGYTRIHKFGNRPGDNAPHAILELVDNPRDLRWEMTARAVGREVLKEKLKVRSPTSVIKRGVEGIRDVLMNRSSNSGESHDILRSKTRWNVQKILKFRDQSASSDLGQKAERYIDHLLATPMALRTIHDEMKERNPQNRPPRPKAGQALPGETQGALRIAQGELGQRKTLPVGRILSLRSVFGRGYKRT